jgi:hypothetical protein
MRRKNLLAGLALLAVLSACASGDGSIRSNHLPTILYEVRGHPEQRDAGEAACVRSLDGSFSNFPYKLFFAGFFDVTENEAGHTFCAAIIEGVISGDITQSELDAFKRPAALRGRGPLGTLLRRLLVAHERLQGQQAEARPAAIAGPSS